MDNQNQEQEQPSERYRKWIEKERLIDPNTGGLVKMTREQWEEREDMRIEQMKDSVLAGIRERSKAAQATGVPVEQLIREYSFSHDLLLGIYGRVLTTAKAVAGIDPKLCPGGIEALPGMMMAGGNIKGNFMALSEHLKELGAKPMGTVADFTRFAP